MSHELDITHDFRDYHVQHIPSKIIGLRCDLLGSGHKIISHTTILPVQNANISLKFVIFSHNSKDKWCLTFILHLILDSIMCNVIIIT